MFRDGRVLTGTWARAHPAGRTSYLDARRTAITLDPGGAWMLLAVDRSPGVVPLRTRRIGACPTSTSTLP